MLDRKVRLNRAVRKSKLKLREMRLGKPSNKLATAQSSATLKGNNSSSGGNRKVTWRQSQLESDSQTKSCNEMLQTSNASNCGALTEEVSMGHDINANG